MAKISELCSNIPVQILRDQELRDLERAMRELNRRKALTLIGRENALRKEVHVFNRCVQRRPERGKCKNTASSEHAGRIGTIVVGIRTGKHSVCVCKPKKRM